MASVDVATECSGTGTPEDGPIEPSDSSEAPVPSKEQVDAWAIL